MMYVVAALKSTITVAAGGAFHEKRLSWAEGMSGAMPVFYTREDALEWAGEGADIIEVEIREDS